MKKLQSKTFILLVTILSVFIATMTFIFNFSLYNNEHKELEKRISRVNNINDNLGRSDKFMFMDSDVYVVSFDRNGNITNINNYTNDNLSSEDIIELINNHNKKIGKIGNLYFNKYLLYFNNNLELVVINNSNVRGFLLSNLYKSIIIFVLLELIVFYISIMLTKWLVKPVNESFEKQKQFIYDASHELKTPLAIIMASADEMVVSKKNKDLIDNIKSETDRMNKLVGSLLELSKVDGVSNNTIYSEVDLSKLIKNKALSFDALMYENSLTLDLDVESDIKFRCDEDRIRELLSILIDNAIKHAYSDSKITVKLSTLKGDIILSVINRGDEIPVSEREKIFERFYRGDKSRNRDSNRYGLGLAIASNIVSNHNGKISVDCLNGYTTFTIIFKKD